jgi:hypothetical protein
MAAALSVATGGRAPARATESNGSRPPWQDSKSVNAPVNNSGSSPMRLTPNTASVGAVVSQGSGRSFQVPHGTRVRSKASGLLEGLAKFYTTD